MIAKLLRFEGFEVDVSAHRVRSAGREVHLQPIPFQLLCLLIEHRGQLVAREEIVERIWGKHVFIDSENSINTAVRKLRRALNDDAKAPRCIITVPSSGYRFDAVPCTPSAELVKFREPRSVFVGRDREMAEFRAALAEGVSGHGRLVLISGEPGIGKTRLAREIAGIAQARGMEVLEGECSAYDEAIPYLPFVEILDGCVERASGADHLRKILGDEGPELARLLPKVRRILPDLPPALELPAPQARRHLFNCFCDFVARRAREQAILLILEDVHRADDSTLALLAHLAPRLSELPLVVVATYRDPELEVSPSLTKILEELLRRRLAAAFRLVELRCDEIAQMLGSLSGRLVPAAVVKEIYDETKGNPFFVEELFRHLEEENRLYEASGVFRTELKIAAAEVPRSVRLVVGRRLARLSERTQKMLGTAAIIGRSFTLELLGAATRADPDSLLECVEEAERAGMVLSCAESSKASLEFSHELVRQAVISGLSAVRHQRLHLEIAETIEALYSDRLDEHLDELAHHYRHSSNTMKAIDYLRRAGKRMADLSALRPALDHFAAATNLLNKIEESVTRDREEARICMAAAAPTLWAFGEGSVEQERLTERALELGARLNHRKLRFFALSQLADIKIARGDLVDHGPLFDEMMTIACDLGDPVRTADVHFWRAAAELSAGEFRAAAGNLGRSIGISEQLSASDARRLTAPAVCYAYSGSCRWFLGYPDQALANARQGVSLARDTRRDYELVVAEYFLGAVHQLRREWEEGRRILKHALEVSTQRGFPLIAKLAAPLHRIGLSEAGAEPEREWLVAMATRAAGGPRQVAPARLEACARLFAKLGRHDEAERVLDDAFAAARRGIHNWDSELHRTRGELSLLRSPNSSEMAERCFRAAIDVARQQCARSLELRATTSLARLLKSLGRRDEARAALAEIYGCFTEGFDTADLKDAKALLEELVT
jgi:DNA-binding winged helix-turn-helix (wHTH) protein/tetratricopeptide (TPR) repeat protein